MQINYYINNQEVHRPLNYAELSIELNYDKDDNQSNAVSLTEFEWGVGLQVTSGLADAAKLINDWLTDGLTSGVGVFEGIPFRIELTHEGTTYDLFDGYLDASKARFDCDRVIVSAIEKGRVDWLNEVADSVSFAYLYDPNFERPLNASARITNSDFLSIPYVLNSIPDTKEAVIATVSVAFLVDAIATQLEELLEFLVRIVNPLAFTTVIELILRIIYIGGLIITLVQLIKRVVNLIIQPTKYHDAMRVKTLCEKGAAHFGLNFSSTILDIFELKDLIILPKKFSHDAVDVTNADGSKDGLIGFLNPNNPDARGYYDGTFGDLLRALKEMFNAKIIIEGNTLRLEREDYVKTANNYILPPVDQTDFTLNTDEFKANYVVEFLTDINDKNSINNYEGTVTQRITQPVSVVNRDMVIMSGLETRTIPFARASFKIKDTNAENVINSLAVVFDPIASFISNLVDEIIVILEDLISKYSKVFLLALSPQISIVWLLVTTANPNTTPSVPTLQNLIDFVEEIVQIVEPNFTLGIDLTDLPKINYTPIGSLFDNRTFMLLMENDFIDVDKILIIDSNNDNKVNAPLNAQFIDSQYLYENYHFLRTFVGDSTKLLSNGETFAKGNQYKRYSKEGVPFCFDDYENLRNSNYLKDDEGNTGKLISARWNIEQQTASIDFQINEKYTNNLEDTIITPDGK